MPATSFGDGVFGIEEDEIGILIESISFNFTNDKKMVKSRVGDDVGVTYYNEKCEISFKGSIPDTAPFSSTLAASLVLQNSIPAHLKAGVSGGSLLIEEIGVEQGAEEYQTLDVKAVYYPFIAAA